MGHQPFLNPELSNRFVGHPTWTFSLPANEEIQALIPSRRDPVASIGKVLGNRSTLYKYLIPHLIALTTSSLTSHPPSCAIYVIDAVKGSIVYHATLPTSAGVCGVKATVSENWLMYSYFDEDFFGVGQSKGHRIVSVEFYKGIKPDDKAKRFFLSLLDYSVGRLIPMYQLEIAFVFPFFKSCSCFHDFYQINNVRKNITAPALLESTPLVFAYCLDLFLTRVSLSGTFDVLNENFNKTHGATETSKGEMVPINFYHTAYTCLT
jgi:hypothetical protein